MLYLSGVIHLIGPCFIGYETVVASRLPESIHNNTGASAVFHSLNENQNLELTSSFTFIVSELHKV